VTWSTIIVGLVAAERLAELILARANTRTLLARGAVERGAAHYPLLVALHAAWLASVWLLGWRVPNWYWLAVYVLLQIARVWVLASLGRYWTTRVITLPGAELVRRGPYRFLRHPNYAVVIAEIAILPLVFGEYDVAIVFSVLNAAVLAWRIRIENRALAERR
jgi:methyltransferase